MSFLVEYTDPQWRQLDMRALDVDQAYLYVESQYGERSYLYTLSDECYTVFQRFIPPVVDLSIVILFVFQCPYTKVKALPALESLEALKLSSAYDLSFKIYAHDQGHYAYDNV